MKKKMQKVIAVLYIHLFVQNLCVPFFVVVIVTVGLAVIFCWKLILSMAMVIK